MIPEVKSILALEGLSFADAVGRLPGGSSVQVWRNRFSRGSVTASEVADLVEAIGYYIEIKNDSGEVLPAASVRQLVQMCGRYEDFRQIVALFNHQIKFVKK